MSLSHYINDGLYIIIGANGGIGADVVRSLVQDYGLDPAQLVLTARDVQNLQGLAGQHFNLNVSDPDSCREFVEKIGTQKISGFCYAVGSIVLKPLKATQDQDFINTFDLNLLGAVRLIKPLEKNLKDGHASVVMFSTIAVTQGFTNHTVIASAKGAVEAFVKSLAAEWAPAVRVNAIAPSLTDTGIAKSLTSSAQMAEAIAALHPIPRLGQPQDSGQLASFLLSSQSSWMTGQILHVDGGRSSLRVKG
jgi:NAD(P)-dependent dehydrogenase (short-subunit alcohol dehydrogenase family)